MKNLTFTELASLYCETQVNNPANLLATLKQSAEKFHPIGFLLLECQMLDSSFLGNRTICPYGPNNTFQEIPAHPIALQGLASRTSTVIGVMPVEELDKP